MPLLLPGCLNIGSYSGFITRFFDLIMAALVVFIRNWLSADEIFQNYARQIIFSPLSFDLFNNVIRRRVKLEEINRKILSHNHRPILFWFSSLGLSNWLSLARPQMTL